MMMVNTVQLLHLIAAFILICLRRMNNAVVRLCITTWYICECFFFLKRKYEWDSHSENTLKIER